VQKTGVNDEISIKNSINRFQRAIEAPAYAFNGTQTGSFTELTYSSHGEKFEWISGINLYTDKFEEQYINPPLLRDYEELTIGGFIENNWRISTVFHLETGLRGDYVDDYEFVVLPRVSLLIRGKKFSSRIGGGLGYKTPTIFTEESERINYKNVFPIDPGFNTLERSYGFNADFNYKTSLFEDVVEFSWNHLFFYTRIHDPLLLKPYGSFYRFENEDGHFDSKGMETNLRLGYEDFKLFLGYTFTDAYLHNQAGKKRSFLTPRHRLNSVLLYEVEEKWKLGLEAYYFSKQDLSDGKEGKSYWITGFMAEKLWEKFSLYINFENFTDTRQTKFDTIYTGSIQEPVFRDIYAPLDGFVVNGGIKIRL
jgi:iron complex outermembrane receptor protein